MWDSEPIIRTRKNIKERTDEKSFSSNHRPSNPLFPYPKVYLDVTSKINYNFPKDMNLYIVKVISYGLCFPRPIVYT